MPNGRPGDNPITDVVVWGRPVYGEDIDSLVREIAELLGDQPEVDASGARFESPFDRPPLVGLIFAAEDDVEERPRLREELLTLRARLKPGRS